jgi:hypothetical protein
VDWIAFETLWCCIQLLKDDKKSKVESDGICLPALSSDIPKRSMGVVCIVVQAYFHLFEDLGWVSPLVFAHGDVSSKALGFRAVANDQFPACVDYGISDSIPDIQIINCVHEAFISRNLTLVCFVG